MISVEHAVSQRFPDFPLRNPAIYKTVVALLRIVFRESEFRRFSDRYPHLTGFDFVEQALDHFDFGISVSDRHHHATGTHRADSSRQCVHARWWNRRTMGQHVRIASNCRGTRSWR